MDARQDIEALASQEEGQYFDRKSLWHGPRDNRRPRKRREVRDEIARYVAAFANADGGVLVLGVEDDGAPTGHGYPSSTLDEMLAVPERRLNPPQPRGEIAQLGDVQLLVFDVEPSASAVMVTGDGFPFRSHDEVIMMEQTKIEAIKRQGLVESAEARSATGRVIEDLDSVLLGNVCEEVGLKVFIPKSTCYNGVSRINEVMLSRCEAERSGSSLA